MTAVLQGHMLACGRAARPLHDAFLSRGRLPQHISDRGGGGRDHEDLWLEAGVDGIVHNRGHLSEQMGSKRKCCQSYADVSELPLSPRLREMIEAMLRKFR